MKKTIYFLSIVFMLILGSSKQSSASHYAACDLTYTCLGGNDYLVTLTFFRDCSGISMTSSLTVYFNSSCSNFSSSFPLVGSGVEVTPTCPGQSTTCSGGSLYGLQRYVYQKQVTIPPCANWTIYHSDCCRNPSNTLDDPTSMYYYIPATLNNLAAPCNSSPSFTNMPATVICQGQNFCYNHGAIDPDGDSLVYVLTSPFEAAGDPIDYMGGYSGTNPLPSSPPVSVDPVTGDVCMNPTSQIIAVIGVRVEEWRRINNVPTMIGSILRDMQVNVIACNNLLPIIAGINPNATQYSTADSIYHIEACLGDTVAFRVYPYDGNVPAQNLTLSWNSGIPDGQWGVTDNGTPNAVGHFFWIPTSGFISNVPVCFTVNVKDDNCPYIGQQTFSYCITIKGIVVDLYPPGDSLLCMGESYQIFAHGDTNVVNYQWFIDGVAATPVNDTTFNINSTTLGPGVHTIGVRVDDGSTTLCPGYDAVTINVVPQPDVNLGPDQIVCEGQTVTLNPQTTGQNYLWYPNGEITPTLDVTTTGIYGVWVDGGNNTRCQDTGSVYIRFLDMPTVNLGPDTCITAPITLDAGYPGYEYNWTTGASSQTINVTVSGTYVVTVSEEFGHGCDDRDTITIALNPIPDLKISSDLFGYDAINICSHHTVNLTVNDEDGYLDNPNYVYTYYWPGNGASTRTVALTCLPEGPNDIKVYVTGCTVEEAVKTVTTRLCSLELPNVFTPNDDQYNQFLKITGIEDFPNSTLQVFNRWGKKIFESKNYNNSDNAWDGGNQADGVYYYVLTVNYGGENNCMEARNYNGTITIIR